MELTGTWWFLQLWQLLEANDRGADPAVPSEYGASMLMGGCCGESKWMDPLRVLWFHNDNGWGIRATVHWLKPCWCMGPWLQALAHIWHGIEWQEHLDIWLLLFGNYVDGPRHTSHAVIELEPFEYQVSMAIDRDVPNHMWMHPFRVLSGSNSENGWGTWATLNRWDLFYFGNSGNWMQIMHDSLSWLDHSVFSTYGKWLRHTSQQELTRVIWLLTLICRDASYQVKSNGNMSYVERC
jgi:hypothetical protein